MKKDFDIFNDIKVDLDQFEEAELNDIEKKKIIKKAMKKINNKKPKKRLSGTIAVSVAVVFILMLSNKGVYGKILSEMESFFNKGEGELEPYRTKAVGTMNSEKDTGIIINFNDVILDDMYILGKIDIDWTKVDLKKYGIVEDKNNKIKFKSAGECELYLNDKVVSRKKSIYGEENYEEKISQFIRIEYNPEEVNLKEKEKIKLIIKDIYIEISDEKNNYKGRKKVEGEWEFYIDIDNNEIQKKLKAIDVNTKRYFENEFYKVNILVKQYRESAISKKIILKKTEEKESNPFYTVITEFYDENENKIEYSWVAENDERTILEIKDNKEYKRIKVISKIAELDGNMNLKKIVTELEPIIINLEK